MPSRFRPVPYFLVSQTLCKNKSGELIISEEKSTVETEIVGCPIKTSLNEEPIIFWLKVNSRYDGYVTKTAFRLSAAITLHLVPSSPSQTDIIVCLQHFASLSWSQYACTKKSLYTYILFVVMKCIIMSLCDTDFIAFICNVVRRLFAPFLIYDDFFASSFITFGQYVTYTVQHCSLLSLSKNSPVLF